MTQGASADADRWVAPRVAVWACPNQGLLASRAKGLADELELPAAAGENGPYDLLLVVTEAGLELREVGPKPAGGVRVDLDETGANRRRLAGVSRGQPLARALGIKNRSLSVIDATAGLGRDSLVLARLGCTVTAIERSPIIAAMWRDALQRAASQGRSLQQRINFIAGNAEKILAGMPADQRPDVVYLDPMYAPKSKSALPKKELRILRRLVGDDLDADALLAVARRTARDRVVVKRSPRAPALAPAPSMSYVSKLARFDVYRR